MKKRISLLSLMAIMLVFIVACGSDNDNNAGNDNNEDSSINDLVFDQVGVQETNAEKYADVFAEADKVADEVRIAYMTYDYGALMKHASPLLEEQLKSGEHKSFDPNIKEARLPNAEEIVGEFYEFTRFDDLYNEEDQIVWYSVSTLLLWNVEGIPEEDPYFIEDRILLSEGKRLVDEPEKILDIVYPNGARITFGLKKNDEGEWKAGEFSFVGVRTQFDNIDQDERDAAHETKTYIHEKPTEEEVKENYMEKEDSFGF